MNLNDPPTINTLVDENAKKMEEMQAEIKSLSTQLDIANQQLEIADSNIRQLTAHQTILSKKIELLKAVRTILENTIAQSR